VSHILFISSWYPNRNAPTHGIFNLYFAQAVSLFHKVSVIHVCSDPFLQQETEAVETHIDNISTVTVYYKKIQAFKPFKKYKRVIAAYDLALDKITALKGKPDIIHLNVVMPAGIAALRLSKKHHIPFVVNENWSGYTKEDGNYKGLFKKYFTGQIVSNAKAILPTSRYLMNAMLSHNLKGNYFVIPNVVNTDSFKPIQENHVKGTTFIHVSSLNDREKNVSGIIRAFYKASGKAPGIFLKIVGEGIDEPYYKKLVADLNLTGLIKFTGRLMSSDLVKEINSSDALVMFSNYETFCLVNIEAFACGKPVITSDAGAIPEYMKPGLGIIVPKGNEDELTGALISFVKNKDSYDHTYIRNYAVENYSYHVIGKKLSEIYQSVLNKKST
jgi:L-malate glycosyltransferase